MISLIGNLDDRVLAYATADGQVVTTSIPQDGGGGPTPAQPVSLTTLLFLAGGVAALVLVAKAMDEQPWYGEDDLRAL